MLFTYGNHRIFNYITESLRVRQKNIFHSPRRKERVSLSAFNGSMTVEAAIVVPVFLLAICGIIRFFVLIDFQNILQMDIDNTSSLLSCLQYNADEENNIAKGYAAAKVLSGKAAKKAEDTGVAGGKYGLIMSGTDLSADNEINSLVVCYSWSVPYGFGKNSPHLKFIQRSSYIPWIGEKIEGKETDREEMVYITKNGIVYHKSIKCTYLTRCIKKVSHNGIGNIRNMAGGKYYKCEKCAAKGAADMLYVYITVYGDRYHFDKECNALKRYIEKVPVSEVGGRRICSKCGGKD